MCAFTICLSHLSFYSPPSLCSFFLSLLRSSADWSADWSASLHLSRLSLDHLSFSSITLFTVSLSAVPYPSAAKFNMFTHTHTPCLTHTNTLIFFASLSLFSLTLSFSLSLSLSLSVYKRNLSMPPKLLLYPVFLSHTHTHKHTQAHAHTHTLTHSHSHTPSTDPLNSGCPHLS